MGTAVKGKEYLVAIHDGNDPGELIVVPYQGDATFASGKSSEISVTKNGKHPYSTEEGSSVTFTYEKERPALAVHTRLRTLSETGEQVQASYGDSIAGGENRTGSALVTLGDETANTDGIIVISATLSFVDDPVIGAVV